jgi:hypothetical protein
VAEGIFSRRAVAVGRPRPHRIREIIRITSFKTEGDVDETEASVRVVHPPSFTPLGENTGERVAPTIHVRKCRLIFSARTIGVTMRTFFEHATV